MEYKISDLKGLLLKYKKEIDELIISGLRCRNINNFN